MQLKSPTGYSPRERRGNNSVRAARAEARVRTPRGTSLLGDGSGSRAAPVLSHPPWIAC
jgi:hypothetical protein